MLSMLSKVNDKRNRERATNGPWPLNVQRPSYSLCSFEPAKVRPTLVQLAPGGSRVSPEPIRSRKCWCYHNLLRQIIATSPQQTQMLVLKSACHFLPAHPKATPLVLACAWADPGRPLEWSYCFILVYWHILAPNVDTSYCTSPNLTSSLTPVDWICPKIGCP